MFCTFWKHGDFGRLSNDYWIFLFSCSIYEKHPRKALFRVFTNSTSFFLFAECLLREPTLKTTCLFHVLYDFSLPPPHEFSCSFIRTIDGFVGHTSCLSCDGHFANMVLRLKFFKPSIRCNKVVDF